MRDVAARLDDGLLSLVGTVVRQDLSIPVEERGDDFLGGSVGGWLVITTLLTLLSLLLLSPATWLGAGAVAALLAVPGGMTLLRGVYDRARARYTLGGLPFLLAVVIAFAAALAVFQPMK